MNSNTETHTCGACGEQGLTQDDITPTGACHMCMEEYSVVSKFLGENQPGYFQGIADALTIVEGLQKMVESHMNQPDRSAAEKVYDTSAHSILEDAKINLSRLIQKVLDKNTVLDNTSEVFTGMVPETEKLTN